MTVHRNPLMTAEQFYAWAEKQDGSFELFDGVPAARGMRPVIHGQTKFRVAVALADAIAKAKLQCHMVFDGPAIEIDAWNTYQPNVTVHSGEALPDDAIVIPNPLIVVEVLLSRNPLKELRDKLYGYFRVPGIQRYLVVDPDKRAVIHYARASRTSLTTRIMQSGLIALNPPDLEVQLDSIFPQEA